MSSVANDVVYLVCTIKTVQLSRRMVTVIEQNLIIQMSLQ